MNTPITSAFGFRSNRPTSDTDAVGIDIEPSSIALGSWRVVGGPETDTGPGSAEDAR